MTWRLWCSSPCVKSSLTCNSSFSQPDFARRETVKPGAAVLLKFCSLAEALAENLSTVTTWRLRVSHISYRMQRRTRRSGRDDGN